MQNDEIVEESLKIELAINSVIETFQLDSLFYGYIKSIPDPNGDKLIANSVRTSATWFAEAIPKLDKMSPEERAPAIRVLKAMHDQLDLVIKTYIQMDHKIIELLREHGDEAKIEHKLKPIGVNTVYVLLTQGSVYQLQYDNDFKFSLIKVDGNLLEPEVIPGPLSFVGNLTADNVIFKPGDMPIISIGDRLVFSKFETTDICYITSAVVDIINESEVN